MEEDSNHLRWKVSTNIGKNVGLANQMAIANPILKIWLIRPIVNPVQFRQIDQYFSITSQFANWQPLKFGSLANQLPLD